MCGGDHSYPGVQLAAWDVTEEKFHEGYFFATYLKLLTTSILPVGQLPSAARCVCVCVCVCVCTSLHREGFICLVELPTREQINNVVLKTFISYASLFIATLECST